MAVVALDYYAILGVAPLAAFDELRAAYRSQARILHPDVAESVGTVDAMARLNEAWRVLSNPDLRERYDATRSVPMAAPQPPPAAPRSRRQAWVAGVQAQMYRLGHQAGKSATQTLLLRHPLGPRSDYEAVVDSIVDGLLVDTEARVRAARAAGAAPLDLGVAATLIGIRSLADKLRRQSTLGITNEMLMAAHLLDRMWDVMAYELPSTLANRLGGNPSVAHALHI